MTPSPLDSQVEAVVRHLRGQSLRLESLHRLLGRFGAVREVRFVPGSARTSYILPGMSLAVLVQPDVFPAHVLKTLEGIAKRDDIQALLLVDSRWQSIFGLPAVVCGKVLRTLVLGVARG